MKTAFASAILTPSGLPDYSNGVRAGSGLANGGSRRAGGAEERRTGSDRQDATVGVDFNTYGDVLLWTDRIRSRAVIGMDMPPAGGPNPEERLLLEEWLDCSVEADRTALEAE